VADPRTGTKEQPITPTTITGRSPNMMSGKPKANSAIKTASETSPNPRQQFTSVHPSLSSPDVSSTPPGNLLRFGADVHLDSSGGSTEFGLQRLNFDPVVENKPRPGHERGIMREERKRQGERKQRAGGEREETGEQAGERGRGVRTREKDHRRAERARHRELLSSGMQQGLFSSVRETGGASSQMEF
ncbi:unnamed protein product, partial [Pleuronectes platessa]